MGAADLVPGVSGGTIAFITGIYQRLLNAIRSFDLVAVRLLVGGEVAAFWRHVDGKFLAALIAGIGTSIFTLARVVLWWLETQPETLWALFFGLILASAIVLGSSVDLWGWRQRLAILIGTAGAASISLMPAMQLGTGLLSVFLAGMIAICATILPGISGGFLLVLMGMYAPVLLAVKEFDLAVLASLAMGAGIGLLGFSRVLHWLLERHGDTTMATLTGFLGGSLLIVWPWKMTLQTYLDSHGVEHPLRQTVVSPGDYLLTMGREPLIAYCIALMLVGFATVWLAHRRSAVPILPSKPIN
jgi:putative membrane protein